MNAGEVAGVLFFTAFGLLIGVMLLGAWWEWRGKL